MTAQQIAQELWERTRCAEQTDERPTPTEADQVGGEQRVPGLIDIGIDDDADTVGDVVGRGQAFEQLRSGHGCEDTQRLSPWAGPKVLKGRDGGLSRSEPTSLTTGGARKCQPRAQGPVSPRSASVQPAASLRGQ